MIKRNAPNPKPPSPSWLDPISYSYEFAEVSWVEKNEEKKCRTSINKIGIITRFCTIGLKTMRASIFTIRKGTMGDGPVISIFSLTRLTIDYLSVAINNEWLQLIPYDLWYLYIYVRILDRSGVNWLTQKVDDYSLACDFLLYSFSCIAWIETICRYYIFSFLY